MAEAVLHDQHMIDGAGLQLDVLREIDVAALLELPGEAAQLSSGTGSEAAPDALLHLPGDGSAGEIATEAGGHDLAAMLFAPLGTELGLRQCRKPSQLIREAGHQLANR